MIRSFHHSQYPLELLLERKRGPVTVVLPTREVGDTIGPIVSQLQGLEGLIDQILVVDAASEDRTAEIARTLGAEVHQESELLPEFGRALGKGDAMWRALAVARGDVIVYLDSDTRAFSSHFASGMLGPLICDDDTQFVKGFFKRPFTTVTGERRPLDGGRVTELRRARCCRRSTPSWPASCSRWPARWPPGATSSAGCPFAIGYAIETSMLLHARDLLGGTAGMAQVDLDVRHNHHQPLPKLGPMAYAVLRVILERLRAEGRLLDDHAPPLQTADGQLIQVELVERPPYASIRAPAS